MWEGACPTTRHLTQARCARTLVAVAVAVAVGQARSPRGSGIFHIWVCLAVQIGVFSGTDLDRRQHLLLSHGARHAFRLRPYRLDHAQQLRLAMSQLRLHHLDLRHLALQRLY